MLKLISASKIYDSSGVTALRRIDLHVARGDYVSVTGASGSGKSTLMHILGLLDTLSAGSYLLCGTDVSHLSPAALAARRASEIGFVFQQFQLLPGLTALENTALPLAIGGIPRSVRLARARAALLSVGLGDRMEHLPNALSGGQQQRVAIARALVTGPSIICMDEPLSNLDAKLRVQLRNELKKMQREFGITTIYVTHDQEEALTLSDRIAVFNKGYIEQIGTPNEIYNHSKTEFVCNFIGDINRVEAPIAAKMKLAAGQNHFIRLERLHVNKPKRDDEILIDGVVENIEYYGLYIKYYIDVGSQILKAIEKNDGINIYAPGEKVTVAMKPTDVMSYDAQ